MSRGIDYSKWDKMDFSDNEDDNDEKGYDHNTPRVTRLDQPSTVTFGNPNERNNGGSISITQSPTKFSKAQAQNVSTTTSVKETDASSENMIILDKHKSEPDNITSKLSHLTRNGGSFIYPTKKTETFWSQDRHEAVFSIVFDGTQIASRYISVEVKGALNYKDRFAAVGGNKPIDAENTSSKGEVIIKSSNNGHVLFKGHLAYSIYFPENEEEVDWEIDATNPNRKLVKITLLKALPMQGLTIWWSRPFLDYPEIDVVNDIEDRDHKKHSDGSDKSAKNHEQMKAVWDEAHRMFKEKVKNREKQSIDIQ